VVSLTLVPMLCAKLLRHRPKSEETGVARWANAKFQALIDRYGDALRWVLDRQPMTLAVALGTLVVTVLLYVFIPKGFFPVQDTGIIQAITEAPQEVSYGDMGRRQAAMAAAILKDPDVVSLSSFIGVDGTNITLNSGRMLINLKPSATARPPPAPSSAACRKRPRMSPASPSTCSRCRTCRSTPR